MSMAMTISSLNRLQKVQIPTKRLQNQSRLKGVKRCQTDFIFKINILWPVGYYVHRTISSSGELLYFQLHHPSHNHHNPLLTLRSPGSWSFVSGWSSSFIIQYFDFYKMLELEPTAFFPQIAASYRGSYFSMSITKVSNSWARVSSKYDRCRPGLSPTFGAGGVVQGGPRVLRRTFGLGCHQGRVGVAEGAVVQVLSGVCPFVTI